jgi:pimeloyl-ACP methyl ester carboxylesterase
MHSIFPGPYDLPAQQIKLASSVEINYYVCGEAELPVLFLVHGMGNYAPVWFKMMRLLGAHFRCYAIDIPGHGDSPPLVEEESIVAFATVLEDFILAIAPSNYSLVGHSMGGQIVMQACLNKRLTPQRVVLLAPAGFEYFTEKDFAWLSSIYRGGIIEKLGKSRMVSQFRENFHVFPDDAEFMLQDVTHLRDSDRYRAYCHTLSRCARAVFASSVYQQLEGVREPILVYYGQSDVMVPHRVLHADQDLVSLCHSAVERLGTAELRLLPATGHMLHWEAAEEISQGIVSFLSA